MGINQDMRYGYQPRYEVWVILDECLAFVVSDTKQTIGMYRTKTATCSPTNAQQEFCGTVEGDIESVCVCVLDGLLHTLHAATH